MRTPEQFIEVLKVYLQIENGIHIVNRKAPGKSIEEVMQAFGFHGVGESPKYHGMKQDILSLLNELGTEHLIKMKADYDDQNLSNVEDEKSGTFVANGRVIWKFKLEVLDGEFAYIKIKDNSDLNKCICLSFHPDQPE
ncbi:hypothetical protein QE450_002983 [Paenibacillus sp. SORGH_AS306]|uniref:hypothetical protein n=1 Tax=unclassified Paenibacillus TaxID=185978 RepID=UPI002783423D|nr:MULTISPECIES: hypothetical protein [unclassified Paenibacillus]MDQ1235485.1 hypothetical protein [Paenibacillus sp. SORGH_AS_0306]MDR6112534.1 hypothetical protein [Paenibacillus sp. SORGH_AS_0338]